MKAIWVFVLAVLTAAFAAAAESAPAKNLLPAEADAAWQDLEKSSKPPAPPADWAGKTPTPEQRKEFYKFLGEQSEVVAEKAKEFYTRFPSHAKAEEAKEREGTFRRQAQNFKGSSEPEKPVSPEEEAFANKMNEVRKRALLKQDPKKPLNGRGEVIKEMESGLRELMKEYPTRSEPWAALLQAAEWAPEKEDQLRILDDIVNSKSADKETIARAKAAIKAVGALGHPLEIAFTAADGREVDVQKLKGKVVLVDFWASWCGPCMEALPELISLYKKYQPQGLEVIGINMDKQRFAMDNVLKQNEMPWPQYFDGKGWGAKFAIEYNVSSIPAVWLVDKKGILRTMNARENLEKQIQDLLAEKT
ncbi:MAG TPA: TlpA disulfide reductase family protein [Verrucomicrobiae bacterium]